jgi:tetratricopeptide (TPR) repeat protein
MTPERAQFSMALSHARLGDALMSRGDLAKTMESYRKAVQLHENLAQNFPHNAVYRRELMMDYNWLGDCAGGLLFINLGDRRAAEEYYRKGLAISEELSAADPKNAHARLDLAVSYGKMGEVLSDTDPAQARDYFRRGLATTNDLLKLAPDEFWYLRRKGMQLRGMAEPTAKLGDLPGAIRELREALGIFRLLADRNPTNARIQSDLVLTHRCLGRMLLEAGDRHASSEHYREAVTLAEAASVSAKSDLHSLWRLADTYAALGSFHASLANDLQIAPAERAAQYRAARSWRQKAFDVWNTWSQHGVSSVFDATRREEAARLLTQTDQELSLLSSK